MLGDPAAISALARALRRRADEIRDLAARLARAADTVAWEGVAAEAMRGAAQRTAGGLRRTAALHDDAADALDRHAHGVSVVDEALAAATHALTTALTTPLTKALGALGALS